MDTYDKLMVINRLAEEGTGYSVLGPTMFEAIKTIVHIDDPKPTPPRDTPVTGPDIDHRMREHYQLPDIDELAILHSGTKIDAIRAYRARVTNVGLKDAKDAFDSAQVRLDILDAYQTSNRLRSEQDRDARINACDKRIVELQNRLDDHKTALGNMLAIINSVAKANEIEHILNPASDIGKRVLHARNIHNDDIPF